MAISETSIANAALQLLGESRRIESLTQDHPNARSMNAAYERTRKSLLRRYDWGFATRRASIAADGDQTTWGGHNRYSIPNDYLRLIRDDEFGIELDWKIEAGAEGEGLFIVTDDGSPLEIRYIADVIDPTSFDALFREAFENRLAAVCCKQVTGSSDLKDRLEEDFKTIIAEAKLVNAIADKPAQEFPEDSWLAARR